MMIEGIRADASLDRNRLFSRINSGNVNGVSLQFIFKSYSKGEVADKLNDEFSWSVHNGAV